MRKATLADLESLVGMMTEFYAEADYALNPGRAQTAFEALLAKPDLGEVWLIQAEGRDAGYLVLTFGYSMEYGGRDAFIDDLFIRSRVPSLRSRQRAGRARAGGLRRRRRQGDPPGGRAGQQRGAAGVSPRGIRRNRPPAAHAPARATDPCPVRSSPAIAVHQAVRRAPRGDRPAGPCEQSGLRGMDAGRGHRPLRRGRLAHGPIPRPGGGVGGAFSFHRVSPAGVCRRTPGPAYLGPPVRSAGHASAVSVRPREPDRRLVAEAETRWVFVDLTSGRRRSLPAELLEAFDPLPDERKVREMLGLGMTTGSHGGMSGEARCTRQDHRRRIRVARAVPAHRAPGLAGTGVATAPSCSSRSGSGAAANLYVASPGPAIRLAEEAPIFAVYSAFPAAVALLIWWRFSHG